MTQEELIRLAFIAHAGSADGDLADIDAKLGWWNRGWIELDEAGATSWTVTPMGRVVLAMGALDGQRAPLPAAIDTERGAPAASRWSPDTAANGD